MKKVVPFTKTITFKTMIAEVTDIEVTHNLSLKDNHQISGDILVDGRYKMTDASQIEEEFHYKLPFVIEVDSKYNLDDLEISIGDFYFEIINEEDLKINVEVDMDGLKENKIEQEVLERAEVLNDENESLEEENEVAMPIPTEVTETKQKFEFTDSNDNNPLEKLEQEIKSDLQINNIDKSIETKKVVNATSVSSIFSSIAPNEETFSTYYVYIVREADTVDTILDKYQITRELLQSYNDLDDIKIGSKLIIPCTNNE